MSQQVLPLLPAGAVPVGPLAGLMETDAGGVVFLNGMATFAFAADDVLGRRLAAVQLVEAKNASVGAVVVAFGVTQVTLWRWREAFAADGVEGLIPAPLGPRGPSKLTEDLAARIRALDAEGRTLAAIAERAGVSTATVRVALGRTGSGSGGEQPAGDESGSIRQEQGLTERGQGDGGAERENAAAGEQEHTSGGGHSLAVLPVPVPRRGERALARAGLLRQAPVVFTEGAHLPMAGLLLILPALEATGLLTAFESVYGRLRDGFYGLSQIILTMLFLALLREGVRWSV